ncbi:MAG: hypothetical protein AAF985_23815 [Bacteroidota bacterium]
MNGFRLKNERIMEGKIIIDPKNVIASTDENLKALKDGIDINKLSQE